MKQYLMAVMHPEEPKPSPEEMEKMFADVGAVNDEIRAAGAWVFAGGLHGASMATVVRIKDDEVLTTDGPYLEAKEYMGGFWVIKAPDLDAALGWAAKATKACGVPIEVRPFQDEADD